jgi:hypothetical protein
MALNRLQDWSRGLIIAIFARPKYSKRPSPPDFIMSNQEIQALLAIDSLYGWEMVYDEYSAVMYGSILGLTRNQYIAQQILIEVYRQLHDQKILLTTSPDDWQIKLITFSTSVATQYLSKCKTDATEKSKTRWQSIGESLHKIGRLRLVFSAKRTKLLR